MPFVAFCPLAFLSAFWAPRGPSLGLSAFGLFFRPLPARTVVSGQSDLPDGGGLANAAGVGIGAWHGGPRKQVGGEGGDTPMDTQQEPHSWPAGMLQWHAAMDHAGGQGCMGEGCIPPSAPVHYIVHTKSMCPGVVYYCSYCTYLRCPAQVPT